MPATYDVPAKSPRISPEDLDTGRQYPKIEGLHLSRPAVTPMPECVTTVLEANRLTLNLVDLPRVFRAHISETRPDLETEKDGVIRVALIEDNQLVREALTALLNRAPDLQVTALAPNDHARAQSKVSADVVLLDLGLENGDSLRVARDVMQDFPGARVIVMDLLPTYEKISELVSADVSGFIMKDANLDVVLNTVRAVAAGLKVLPDQVTATLFFEIAREAVANGGSEADDSVRMTTREREVVNLIAEGLSNKAIGKRLHISVHTVKSHVRNIMEKHNVNSRLQLAAYVHQRDAGVADYGRRLASREAHRPAGGTRPPGSANRDAPGPRSRHRGGHVRRRQWAMETRC